jgi:dihydrofolate reductase
MRVSIMAAVSANGVIGDQGALPWRLPSDLRRFRRLTMGHALIMGRKTAESIGRLLPGRKTIVLTRQANYQFPGACVCHSVDEALEAARDNPEAFVIGGAEVYRLFWPHADRVYLTTVEACVEGDTYLPPWHKDQWKLVEEEFVEADQHHAWPHRFQVFERS